MTQKEKLIEAKMFACHVKGIAESIRREGNSYDKRWHLEFVNDLKNAAENILKKLK